MRCDLGKSGADALGRAALDAVKVADLNDTHLSDSTLEALCENHFVARLRGLYVSATQITDRGIAALVKADPTRLKRLEMITTPVTESGLMQLLTSPLGPRLEEIRVGAAMTAKVAAWMESTETLPRLQKLCVHGGETQAGVTEIIAQSPRLRAILHGPWGNAL